MAHLKKSLIDFLFHNDYPDSWKKSSNLCLAVYMT
jgi:hypothetical protein